MIKTKGEFSTRMTIFPSNSEVQAMSGLSVLLILGKEEGLLAIRNSLI